MSRKDQGQELVHLLEGEDYLEEDEEEIIQSVVPPKMTSRTLPNVAEEPMPDRHDDEDVEEARSGRKKKMTCRDHLQGILTVLISSWINFLLAAVPFTLISYLVKFGYIADFILSIVSMIPLVWLLRYSIRNMVKNCPKKAKLAINFIVVNAVEIIITIIALNTGLTRLVQALILGFALCKLLVVFGVSLLSGSAHNDYVNINSRPLHMNSLIMLFGLCSLFIPFVLSLSVGNLGTVGLLKMSRATSLLLMIMAVLFIVLLSKTHKANFIDIQDGKDPKITLIGSVILFLVAGVLLVLETILMLSTLPQVHSEWGLSYTFLGMIVIPSVSHVADNFAMARATLRGHIEGVTSQLIFSSTLMFILMAPILVIIGWIANISLSLNFLLLEVLSVLVPAFIMNKWTREGQMHWLHGALMIVIYGILAIAFYFHPDPL
jgi:Ca2+:H+ antiporter